MFFRRTGGSIWETNDEFVALDCCEHPWVETGPTAHRSGQVLRQDAHGRPPRAKMRSRATASFHSAIKSQFGQDQFFCSPAVAGRTAGRGTQL